MNDAIGRRAFLGTSAAAAMAFPDAMRGRPPEQAKPKVKRIAIEEHWTSEDVRLAIQRPKAANTDRQADLGEIRLKEMDAAGITMQVIANSSYQGITDVSKAVDLAEANNDHLAERIAQHPDRFAGFAALPTQDPKAAAKELERAVRKLGLKGAMIEGQDHANWEYLDSQRFWGLWECAASLEVPIYLHPNKFSLETYKLVADSLSSRGAPERLLNPGD